MVQLISSPLASALPEETYLGWMKVGFKVRKSCWAMLKDGDMLTQYDLLLGGDWNHGIFQVNLWLIYG